MTYEYINYDLIFFTLGCVFSILVIVIFSFLVYIYLPKVD